MILGPQNSSNPLFWGKELKFAINGELHDAIPMPNFIRISYNWNLEIPDEVDFLKTFYGNYWPNAKEYFRANEAQP